MIPALREAEAGELLEPRRQRLWWAEIMPLHSSLGNKSETPSQKKKKSYYLIKREVNVIVEEGENKEPVFYNYLHPNLNLSPGRLNLST